MAFAIGATSGVSVFGAGTDPFANTNNYRSIGFSAKMEMQETNRNLETPSIVSSDLAPEALLNAQRRAATAQAKVISLTDELARLKAELARTTQDKNAAISALHEKEKTKSELHALALKQQKLDQDQGAFYAIAGVFCGLDDEARKFIINGDYNHLIETMINILEREAPTISVGGYYDLFFKMVYGVDREYLLPQETNGTTIELIRTLLSIMRSKTAR